MRVYRLEPKSGVKQYAIQKHGFYILGDRKRFGKKQHHSANEVLVPTEQEMIDLILEGHYVRVKDDVDPRGNLVRLNLYIDGKKVT
ncbi:hypothetical protein ASD54_03655 [Rhizobium sp. Root149]|uniref:hypothetical protein n=1 Tax=Rhizobium sp. Root149 TaxID=1736473 RepID=UPI0007154DB1|nr:hypothetical protein [Rhizobium sp. Root149]KQZ54451.1 hypothetical protein ASD54_03655 [Rhizobium sp. Root149]